jgi:uncharacterized delta-60 repeat protein
MEDRCLLSAGALDPSFGSGGTVTTVLKSGSQANAVAIQSDGKIVAVGNGGASLHGGYVELARYNTDGTLDTSFGSSGKVETKFGGGPVDAVAIQPDGKIVVSGGLLMRYNANGTLDTTFGSKGTVTPSFEMKGLGIEVLNGVAEIVGAGGVGLSNTNDAFAVARYNPSGSLDSSFGNGGEVITDITSSYDDGNAVAIQTDGKILVAGNSNGRLDAAEIAVVRYNTNGSLDSSFGIGGIAQTAVGAGRGYAIALQSDGKIVVAGQGLGSYSGVHGAVARYTASGAADTSFGAGAGYVVTPMTGTNNDYFDGVAVQGNGQIVGVGNNAPPSGGSSGLVRYNTDGTLDNTFGNGGIVVPTFGGADSGVAIQADGKIVVSCYNGGNFGVARYLPSEPEIGSFTASPNPVTSGSSTTLTASNITDGNAGATITQVSFYYFDGSGNNVTLGNGTQTSPGVWTLNWTVNLTAGTYTIYAQAEDSYGVFGDTFALALTVQ